jgi:2,5-diketo-D-gluconate reductase B
MDHQTIKGEKVPSLGLGTYRLTGEECTRAVERALALGYRASTQTMWRTL